jgi:hypothetical protein
MSRSKEALLHTICALGGATAFATFYTLCLEINNGGYNEATQRLSETDAFEHIDADDDRNDEQTNIPASRQFASSRNQFDDLLQSMLVVWLCFLGVAVGLWLWLRFTYTRLVRAWRKLLARQERDEAADAWASTRRSEWQLQREVASLQKGEYRDIANPLEPYVVVFFAFAMPAVVMTTSYCRKASMDRSEASDVSLISGSSLVIEYGTCDVLCELVLAFRSLAAVVVFFLSRERRAELLNFRTTCRRLWERGTSCGGRHSDGARQNNATELDTLAMLPEVRSGGGNHVGSSQWQLDESDVIMDKVLAEGTFGVVWEGRWCDTGRHGHVPIHDVAIKVLKVGGVDKDGDVISMGAEEDFEKECEMLLKLDHPHLLKFHGYGCTSAGTGFIVTELMALGSLRVVLRRRDVELQWTDCVSIAVQLAKGLAHLHSIQIIHRDFKVRHCTLDGASAASASWAGILIPLAHT